MRKHRQHRQHRLWLLAALFFATFTLHAFGLLNCAYATGKNSGVQLHSPPGTPEPVPVDEGKGQHDRTRPSTDTNSSSVVDEDAQTEPSQNSQGSSRLSTSLTTEAIPADGFIPLLEGANLPLTMTVRLFTRGRGYTPAYPPFESGNVFTAQPQLMNAFPLLSNRQSSPIRRVNSSPQSRLNLSIKDRRRFILVLFFPDVIRKLETEISKGVSIPAAIQQHAQLPVHQTATIIELLSHPQLQSSSATAHNALQELLIIINIILTANDPLDLQAVGKGIKATFSKNTVTPPIDTAPPSESITHSQQMDGECIRLFAQFFRQPRVNQEFIWTFTAENIDRAKVQQIKMEKLLKKIKKYNSGFPKQEKHIIDAYKNNVIYLSTGDGTHISRQWSPKDDIPTVSEIEEYHLKGASHINLPLLPPPLIFPAMEIMVTTAYKQCFSSAGSLLFSKFNLAKFLSEVVLIRPFAKNNEETALVMVKVMPLLAGKCPPIASEYYVSKYIGDLPALGNYFISASLSSYHLISRRRQLDNDNLDDLPNEGYENAEENLQRRLLFKSSSPELEDALSKLEEEVFSIHDDKLKKLLSSPFTSFSSQEVSEREDESEDESDEDADDEFDNKENVPPPHLTT